MTRLPVGSSLADSTTFSAAPTDTLPWYWHGQLWSRGGGQDYDWRERGSTTVVGRSSRSPVESAYMTSTQYLDLRHIPAPQWGLWTSDSYGVEWDVGEQRTYPAHIRPSLNAARPATLDEVPEGVWVDVPTHGLPVIVLAVSTVGALFSRDRIQRWAELPVPQRGDGLVVALPTGNQATLAHQLGPPSGFAAPARAYADNWRLAWTYGTEYVAADDGGEQWEVMHSYDSLITIQQRQERYRYDDLEQDWGDRRIIHPVVNGTSPFVRHPTDTGRVVAAWTPLYNLDPMVEVTPDGGCVFVCGETAMESSLPSRYQEYAEEVIYAIAVEMGGFEGQPQQRDPTGVVPGTYLYQDGDDWVLDVYIPIQYIAHNGHPEAGPGLDGEVVAHARRPEPNESDGYIGADTYLVAFPARVWTRPNQEVLDPGGGMRLQFAIDDVVGDVTGLDLTDVWIRFAIRDSFGGIIDDWPLDTVDVPPGSTTSDIIDLMVAEVNTTAGVSLTRLDDFLGGSPVRFHFLLQLTSAYVDDNEPFSVDVQIDVEWDNGAVSWFETIDEDLQPEPPVIGPPEGWAIVADTHDTPHRFDRPLYARRPDGNQAGGSVFGESWDAPTFVFQRRSGPTDDGLEGYLGGPTGYDHDTPGWLSGGSSDLRGAFGCATIGQLPPGCWVLAHHVQLRAPSRSLIAERLADNELRDTLVGHLTFSHFWIDQRPRTCPWATIDDDAAIVPGSLPAHDWERDLALPYTPHI